MRSRLILVAVVCLAGSGCASQPAQPPTTDAQGVLHYTASYVTQKVVCADHPIVLEGDHTDMTLTGACRLVTLSGSHNDIMVDMAAGGSFVITGAHNDVTWRQAEPGPPPSTQNKGDSNTYHFMPGQG
ncbi:MAG TPA: DUF3060 domain-containing protein [Acetobacteraceae bacterium]|nr:DUF3060 domain-containing protein [Acetobacteraceae bacterium]